MLRPSGAPQEPLVATPAETADTDGQLDPSAVSTALADLTEADTTPEELFLPEGIMEQINAMLGR